MDEQADSMMERTARSIVRKLRGAGHVAYYAGGSVRDLLRGQVPKDIDVATDARPETVQKMFSRTYAVRTSITGQYSWSESASSRSSA